MIVGLVGFLILQGALLREESRGTHYRTDVPQHYPDKYVILQQKDKTPLIEYMLPDSSGMAHVNFHTRPGY